MSCDSLLELLAQLSATVAGFSGVAGAFRSAKQVWSPWDTINIRLTLLLSLVSCGLSVGALFWDGLPYSRHVSAILFAIVWVGVSVYWRREIKGIHVPPRGPWLLIPVVYCLALTSGIISFWLGQAFYALGIAMLLSLSAAFFFAFTTFFQPADQPSVEVAGTNSKVMASSQTQFTHRHPTKAVERTETALSCGSAAHRQSRRVRGITTNAKRATGEPTSDEVSDLLPGSGHESTREGLGRCRRSGPCGHPRGQECWRLGVRWRYQ